jgi:hypothetical protein
MIRCCLGALKLVVEYREVCIGLLLLRIDSEEPNLTFVTESYGDSN